MNTGDADERAVPDSIAIQIEEGTTPENDGNDYISDDQDPVIQDYQMYKASQDDIYSTAIDDDDLDNTVHLVIQSPNHSCEEASEYHLQR